MKPMVDHHELHASKEVLLRIMDESNDAYDDENDNDNDFTAADMGGRQKWSLCGSLL